MALKSAYTAGLVVPARTVEGAVLFLESVQAPTRDFVSGAARTYRLHEYRYGQSNAPGLEFDAAALDPSPLPIG